jgi:amino acid synthesis protein
MAMKIRKTTLLIDEVHLEGGQPDGTPLRRVVLMVAVTNPLAGRFEHNLNPLIKMGGELGSMMATRILEQFNNEPNTIEGYGKGAIVGLSGEIEHGYALITRPFARPIRSAFGRKATAWMTSAVKRAALDSSLDVPIASKQALYVRSHYDTIAVTMPDAPLPDEVVVVLAATSRGRLHARIGGLQLRDVESDTPDQYLDRE